MSGKWRRKLLPAGVIAVALLVALLLSSNERPLAQGDGTERELPIVEVLRLAPAEHSFTVETHGMVTPVHATSLRSEVSGRVIEVSDHFRTGRFFRKGEVLLRVDPTDYRVALKVAEAELAKSRARQVQEEALAKEARAQWKARKDAPALALREPFVAEARANVDAAAAALERAQKKLAHTEVRAPYDGIVKTRSAGLGQYLSDGAELGEIFAVAESEVRLPVTDAQLGLLDLPELNSLRDGSPACGDNTLLHANYRGERHTWPASVCRLEGAPDERSRFHHVIARIPDPYRLYSEQPGGVPLKNASYVRANIQGRTFSGVFALPRRALLGEGQVLLVDDRDRLLVREIDYFHADDEFVYVRDGLREGERLCLSQLVAPRQGMQVSVVPAVRNGEEELRPLLVGREDSGVQPGH